MFYLGELIFQFQLVDARIRAGKVAEQIRRRNPELQELQRDLVQLQAVTSHTTPPQ